ncbi:MAG TPA: hypothetical protein VN706_01060 [Gemmatimonadaceae bacterium]|nr:hypothetical protein [Gemmatimonadaceae bacterium]
MHDVDRTLREFEGNEMEFEALEAETGENEQFLGDILGGILGGEMETGETFEAEQSFLGEAEYETQGFLGEAEAVFDEVQEMELAGELLEVANEAELEYFLGNLIKGAGKAIGGFVKSPVGKALGGALKGVAKKALPIAGAALGNMVLPGVGGAIGGKLASAAGNMFGLELEGLSPQDREFEVAKRFVRFAGAAAGKAARTPPHVHPARAAKTAVVAAARRHAPGLLQPTRHNVSVARRRHHSNGRPVSGPASNSVSAPINIPGAPQSPIFRGVISGVTNQYSPSVSRPYTVPSAQTPSYADDGYGADDAGGYSAGARTGRWYRRGRRIVLVGA